MTHPTADAASYWEQAITSCFEVVAGLTYVNSNGPTLCTARSWTFAQA